MYAYLRYAFWWKYMNMNNVFVEHDVPFSRCIFDTQSKVHMHKYWIFWETFLPKDSASHISWMRRSPWWKLKWQHLVPRCTKWDVFYFLFFILRPFVLGFEKPTFYKTNGQHRISKICGKFESWMTVNHRFEVQGCASWVNLLHIVYANQDHALDTQARTERARHTRTHKRIQIRKQDTLTSHARPNTVSHVY